MHYQDHNRSPGLRRGRAAVARIPATATAPWPSHVHQTKSVGAAAKALVSFVVGNDPSALPPEPKPTRYPNPQTQNSFSPLPRSRSVPTKREDPAPSGPGLSLPNVEWIYRCAIDHRRSRSPRATIDSPMLIGSVGSFGVVPPPPVRGRPARLRFAPDVPPRPVLGR
jgi:hypothetical protein